MQLLTLKNHDMGYLRWSHENAECTHMIDGIPEQMRKEERPCVRVSHTDADALSTRTDIF
jgi:hypothetical protein